MGEKVVWNACTVNCGSRCPLRMYVMDGEIKYVETDNTGNDDYGGLHQVRACLSGRSMRRRVYNPDWLKYPMKRVGTGGEGKFEHISWDEAYDIIVTIYAASDQRIWQRIHLIKLWYRNAGWYPYTFMAAGKNAGRPSDELLRRLSQPLR